jgi:Domain of unknown function (DUF4157)
MSVAMLSKKNAAVPAAVKAPTKSPSNGLRIGAANDYFEQEADRVADEIMAGGTAKREWSISRMNMHPPLQRSCGCGGSGGSTGECEECKEKKTLQRKSSGADGVAVAPPIVHEVLNSPGQPLDKATRDFFEPRFGHDLSRVRIHSDAQAAESARAVNASAYTVGSHVVFGRTSSPLERTLLAHELTHVAQQTQPLPSSPISDEPSLEAEANQIASAISHSRQVGVRNASALRISRQESTLPQALAFLTPQDIAKLKGFGAADYQASLDTLEKMFRVTGDLTEKGLPRQFVSTRQASGELRTFLDVIRNPKVKAVKVVPSASGGRSPDLYYGEISGAESRVEVVNITAAAARARAELQQNAVGEASRTIPKVAGNVVNTVEEINTVGKLREAIRVKIKAGSQLSSQNPNTRVGGQPMETGGEVRVSTSHVELSKDEIDGVIKDLQSELANSPATKIVVDTIDKADPRGGRKLFEYAKDEKRNFVSSETRVSYARQAVSDASGDAASTAAKLTTEAEGDVAEHALADAAASRLPKITAQTAEKDLAETASEAFARSATSTATRRMGQAAAPVIGAVFAAPDAWEGVKDIAHGDLFTGVGTIGVAIIDVASQGLHATDEVSGGGGTVLAITIQTWAAAMQFGFESERIRQRSSELKAYMKAHGNHLPPRDELMSYYRLNDEDILILENDIYKAQQNKVTTEDLAKQVRALLAQIDADANKALPQGVTPAGIQEERARLSKLLVALEARIQQEKAQAAKERAAAEEKRRQQNFDRAQQQQKQAATAQATPQLLPSPGVSQQQQQQTAAPDPFGLFSPATPQPLSGISMENAELAGTGFGRMRNALLARYPQLESEHFPQDKVNKYQSDVTAYVNNLDRMIAEFMKKGSAEWPGVKEMRRLRDAADNADRSKLMR